MRILAPLCILLFLGAGAPAAISAPPPNAQAPNSDFRAIIGGTTQYAHGDIWGYTPANTGPLIPMAQEVVRGQGLDLVVSFGGFAVDHADQGDVVYDLTLTKPDGTTKVVAANLTAFHGTVPAPHMMHVAEQLRGLAFDDSDPAGTYRFSAKLQDRIGHAEVEVSSEVKLLGAYEDKPVPADFDVKKMGEWLMHYYERPEPRMALPVLRFLAHDPFIAAHPGGWPPILGTFEMILRDNPWLVSQFQKRLLAVETDKMEQDRLFYVLAYVFRANPTFGEFLPSDQRAGFRAAQLKSWPDADQELVTGSQLDLLWGRFFATGSFAPIQRLVSALDNFKFHGSIDAYKKLDPKPKDIPPEVQHELVYQAAAWSLKSNAVQSRLVHDYLTYLVNDSKTGPDKSLQLALILGYKIKTSDGKVLDPNNPPAIATH